MKDREKGEWSARFGQGPSRVAVEYSESVSFDRRLAESDIACSLAHVSMLKDRKIISLLEYRKIKRNLNVILKEIRQGAFDWRVEDEDVHLNVERRLIELAGEVGKKLHTARSRNDQVAVDIRHWLRGEIDSLVALFSGFRLALLGLAERHVATLMPGFTHLQTAQPVTFAHHLLAYDQMFDRDQDRLLDCRRRMNKSPLGACALAGTGFPIDPEGVAKSLGFDGACENSIDAVSDRDHLIEFCSAASMAMMHLSRLSEELVLWSSQMLGFVRIGDGFATGSSIMPQKRNPDMAELARGKTGRVFGSLMALLTLMKSQPLAYNRDNQEDKERIFDTVDTLESTLRVFAAMLPTIEVDVEAMRKAAVAGFANATELADHLVRRGVPFREAHGVVSAVVRHAERKGVALHELKREELAGFSPRLDARSLDVLDPDAAVRSRRHKGGTSSANCRSAIARSRKRLAKLSG